MSNSTIYEVDEDVFQITTQHDDGRVIVETIHGLDAYEAHTQREMRENTDDGHDQDGQQYTSYSRRTPAGSYQEMRIH